MPTLRAAVLCVLAALAVPAGTQVLATSTVSGRVVDDEGTRLAGAGVTIMNLTDRTRLTVSSGDEGAFTFDGVAVGAYELSAVAEGHAESSYGALAYGQPGTPVRVEGGQDVSGLEVSTPRFGAIRGVAYDHTRHPVDTTVTAYAITQAWNQQELWPVGRAKTVRGPYLIRDLPPGRYLVRAAAREVVPFPLREEDPGKPDVRPVDTFYGDVSDPASAVPIVVEPGRTTEGIDVRGTTQSKAVLSVQPNASGRAFSNLMLSLAPLDLPAGLGVGLAIRPGAGRPSGGRAAGPIRLPAGRYRIVMTAEVAGGAWHWAGGISTDGTTPVAVEPTLAPPATVSGRLTIDQSAPSGDPPRILVVPVDLEVPGPVRGVSTVPDPDGDFELRDLAPGRYVFRVNSETGSRTLLVASALTIDGQDMLDLPFTLVPGQTVDDVDITVADSVTSLYGRVLGEDDTPRTAVTLVVFPADSRYWWWGSNRIQTIRPDTTGGFEVRGLPAGMYLVAVVQVALPAGFADNAALTELAAAAMTVVVPDGEAIEPVVVRIS